MEKQIAGINPWLPWPLCRWRIFTEPIRAERLAALRIFLALVMLVDILTTYGPHVTDFYGPDSLARLGEPDDRLSNEGDAHEYLVRPGQLLPRAEPASTSNWFWSLWRGFDHPLNLAFSFIAWLLLSAWIVCRLVDRPRPGDPQPLVSWNWLVGGWMTFSALALLGFWGRVETLPLSVDPATGQLDELSETLTEWQACLPTIAAGLLLATATLFLALWYFFQRTQHAGFFQLLVMAWTLAVVFMLIAVWQAVSDEEHALNLDWLLLPWDMNPTALRILVALWGLTTFMLLIGCWTRLSAILTWVFMTSFDNLNHYLTDSGETTRYVVFFYVLLTPCAAVWSVDSWRRGSDKLRPVYVSPWAVRVMFLQLILIYFKTGLFKITGETWHDGSSLYRVLAWPSYTRFPLSWLPVQYWMLQVATWLVLVWEISFPLLVLNRWTRLVALCLGVLFHLGILITFEIGFFGLYMLCFYAPLVPWERWSKRVEG